MRGEIVEKSKFILRVACGTAEDTDNGVKYELSTSIGGNPVVRNAKTGRFFVLSWDDILEMAQEAGIDAEVAA